jgi:signal transduction histidine kinase
VIARLTFRFVLLFVAVLAALDLVAYWLYARMYAALIGPALDTSEGMRALHGALARVIETILAGNVPLLIVVAIASYLLAQAAVAPLESARARERQFAADAAHELRSPLATIATVAQAASPAASPESAAAFDTIARSALDASLLVGDLLTLARDPNPALLQREPVDLAALAIRCYEEIGAIAQSRGLTIDVRAQSAIVDGDSRRLSELLRNLLDNAIKHARTRVGITTRSADGNAELIVDNDGVAIPPELRENIFERFFRVSADGEGSGLGLAIVRWIARAHHGDVTVACTGGTTSFTLRLPTV